ncbi:MAG: TRAP transporter TatT component family protein [bacterium]
MLHYLRSRDYGFQLLNRPALRKAALENDLETLAIELNKLERQDVPGLFWAGFGWVSAINLSQDNPDLVAALGTVELMMRRVEKLDDQYFDSGINLFFGVFYASRPAMFGGDPEKAKIYFDKAMEKFGNKNLMIPFLYARFYAPQVQDKDLFFTLMHRVATANMNTEPDRRLNNEIARERAIYWLEHSDELIFE